MTMAKCDVQSWCGLGPGHEGECLPGSGIEFARANLLSALQDALPMDSKDARFQEIVDCIDDLIEAKLDQLPASVPLILSGDVNLR